MVCYFFVVYGSNCYISDTGCNHCSYLSDIIWSNNERKAWFLECSYIRSNCLPVNLTNCLLESKHRQFYTYDFWESQINNCNGYSQYQKYSNCYRILQRNNTPLGTVMKFYLKNEEFAKCPVFSLKCLYQAMKLTGHVFVC
jgi:hypothetical protein